MNRLTLLAACALALTLLVSDARAVEAPVWDDVSVSMGLVDSQPETMVPIWYDIDLDGKRDPLWLSYDGVEAMVTGEDGELTLMPVDMPAKFEEFVGPEMLGIVLDVDGDGDEDLAVICGTANKLVILQNDGGGDFTSILQLDTGNNPSAVTVFDWDGDGNTDVALVNQDDDTLYVYVNSNPLRSIGFGTPNSSGTSTNPNGIAPGDIDPGGDKDEDVVVSGADGEVTYHISGGDGTWTSTELFDTETTIGSMEIFRVVDGRITEVWNCGYKQGVWA